MSDYHTWRCHECGFFVIWPNNTAFQPNNLCARGHNPQVMEVLQGPRNPPPHAVGLKSEPRIRSIAMFDRDALSGVEEANYLARLHRDLNEAKKRENRLHLLYVNLRNAVEAKGPVEPWKRLLDEHMRMMESCGYDDPMKRKAP